MHSLLLGKVEKFGHGQPIEIFQPDAWAGRDRLGLVGQFTAVETAPISTVFMTVKSSRAMRTVPPWRAVVTVVFMAMGHAMAAGQWCGWAAFSSLALLGHAPTRHGMAGVMVPPVLLPFLMLMRMGARVAGFGRSGILRGGGVLGGGNRLVSGSFRHVRLLLLRFALTLIQFVSWFRPEIGPDQAKID